MVFDFLKDKVSVTRNEIENAVVKAMGGTAYRLKHVTEGIHPSVKIFYTNGPRKDLLLNELLTAIPSLEVELDREYSSDVILDSLIHLSNEVSVYIRDSKGNFVELDILRAIYESLDSVTLVSNSETTPIMR